MLIQSIGHEARHQQIANGCGCAENNAIQNIGYGQEYVDDKENVAVVGWPQRWHHMRPYWMVQRYENVEQHKRHNGSAWRQMRYPRMFTDEIFVERRHQRYPNDEYARQIAVNFRTDRCIVLIMIGWESNVYKWWFTWKVYLSIPFGWPPKRSYAPRRWLCAWQKILINSCAVAFVRMCDRMFRGPNLRIPSEKLFNVEYVFIRYGFYLNLPADVPTPTSDDRINRMSSSYLAPRVQAQSDDPDVRTDDAQQYPFY